MPASSRPLLRASLRVLLVASSLVAGALPLTVAAAKLPAGDSPSTTGAGAGGGRIIVDLPGLTSDAPAFYSAQVEQLFRLGLREITSEAQVRLRSLQGRPEVFSLGLASETEVLEITGAGLRDWAVRRAPDGKRFLDLRPTPVAAGTEKKPGTAAASPDLQVTIRLRLREPHVGAAVALPLLGAGDAAGFASTITLESETNAEFRVAAASGLLALGDPRATPTRVQFASAGDARLEVKLSARAAAIPEIELTGPQLTGRVNETIRSVDFRLRGQLRVQQAGARLRLLTGRAALDAATSGDGWHLELVALADPAAREPNAAASAARERREPATPAFAYDLVGERAGTFPLDLSFAAAVREDGDWRTLEFAMPAGVVVPLRLEGFASGVNFDPDRAIVPVAHTQGFEGILPVDGSAAVAWKYSQQAAEGALFFTSEETTDVRVGAGLLLQTARLNFRVLQGKLGVVRVRLDGPGEILGVTGQPPFAGVVGWKVRPGDGGRVLEVQLSRPVETTATLIIQSQATLAALPAHTDPLRLTPEGGVRHAGFVRVSNLGAVRIEVSDTNGLMQLAPAQFPGAGEEPGPRQQFVYRFPAADYRFRVHASQIQAEVGVSQLVTYALAETDRTIEAALELDVREAPLRDWTLLVPADYSVAAVKGNDIADYALESEIRDGRRALKILFGRAIDGRQLIELRLEKNQPAAAGDWSLPALHFPGAKSVRGHIGAIATPGYRLVPGNSAELVEVPLSYFPKTVPGLQQSWRLRAAEWTAQLRVEALGQSVQADVFHLYSIKEGVVYGSVLLNYFVVGAPATEWRIAVPASAGNIDVVGQNVRRDWRREGDQLVVSLHQPVLGAATLLVTFEEPMSARGGTIRPGEVRPLNVQAERGYLEVVSPLQVKHAVRAADGGLLKLEPLELPAEFRLLTTSAPLAIYQYTARPFQLELGIEWYAPGETVEQVVDFAQLSSQIASDGQVVTEARYFVKTRGRKALRLVLPAGVKLWEARVDEELVNARADSEHTLVPLPAKLNPNEPVAVVLRFGHTNPDGASRLTLVAPRTLAPTVINEWTLCADADRRLLPRGGNAQLAAPAQTETGFEWLSQHGGARTAALLLLLGGALLLLRSTGAGRNFVGLLLAVLVVGGAVWLAREAWSDRRVSSDTLSYAATLVPADEAVTIEIANVPAWRALLVPWALALLAAAAGLRIATRRLKLDTARFAPLLPAALLVLAATGLLAHPGGAIYFFVALAFLVGGGAIVPQLRRWSRERTDLAAAAAETSTPPPLPPAGPAPASGAALVLLVGTMLGFGALAPQRAEAAPAPSAPAALSSEPWLRAPVIDLPELARGARAAQACVQTWTIRQERLFAEAEVTVRGGVGESFLLLRAPGVLTEFKSDGLRLGKAELNGSPAYFVAPERDGTFTARVKYELALGEHTGEIALPTGPAATQRVTIDLDQPGWEFVSPLAVQVKPAAGLPAGHSGATLVLAPGARATIRLQPQSRNVHAEATQFFAESSQLYLPGPGVVNGFATIAIRPVQGRVTELTLLVPAGFTVGDVARGPIGAWRFDPASRELRVALEPAQTNPFAFVVATQRGTGALPQDAALEPIRVRDAAGEGGTLALAFAGDAQPESVRPAGLSAVNLQDVDTSTLPLGPDQRPLATVQHAWRFGADAARVELKIAPVAPEVRVATRQLLTFDDDRLVMSVDLKVAITRVGLFQVSFLLPDGLELETASGAALKHWTEATDGGRRSVTLHLNGRTLGEHNFQLTLAGAAPRAQEAWTAPRFSVREATRQTGELLLVPGRGLRLRPVAREKVTQIDPRSIGAMQPGTLAFTLLQSDWTLQVGIEALEAWVTVQALQEVTLREGQTLTRLALKYRVENAAVKHLRVRLPGLTEEQARTVRATGTAVSDIVRVAGTPDVWELRFQRGIAGETEVQLEYQAPAVREANREPIVTPEFPGSRQTTLFAAVRGGGRLELEAGVLPRGWTRIDWSAVPTVLQDRRDRSVPTFAFRVAEPERALEVAVRRHEVAEALKLRVTAGDLTTLLSPAGEFLTAAQLQVEVLEKSTLRVRLPERARLFNTLVNGENVLVVREGDAYLFHVAPNSAQERTASVRLVYAAQRPALGGIELLGPSLNVPLEHVTWRVVIPPGYDLDDHDGRLQLQPTHDSFAFGLDEYRERVSSVRDAEAKKAVALLQEANELLQKGDQAKAGEYLSRASNAAALDEASNEDARVQLRNLKTQQTVLGLNTRRQRLYLDNRGDGARNEQLEQAATINPLMQGKENFNPRELDQLLAGNTVEENSTLRTIAARFVEQQLAAEPSPSSIDVTLSERGRVYTFTRTLQVDGDTPLALKLELTASSETNRLVVVTLLVFVAGLAVLHLTPRRSAEA